MFEHIASWRSENVGQIMFAATDRLVRAKHRSDSYVWPISLRSLLPVVAVPLLAGDADCLLDLQAVFTAGYDNAAYDVGINYSRDPVPPLAPPPPEGTVES